MYHLLESPESVHIIGQTWIVSDYLTTGVPAVLAPFSQCIDFKIRAPERFILGYGPDPRNPKAVDLLHSGILNYDVKICGEIKYRRYTIALMQLTCFVMLENRVFRLYYILITPIQQNKIIFSVWSTTHFFKN